MGRKYNIMIFGATGFTGKHLVLEVVKTLDAAPKDERFSWAIAGRSTSKMDDILVEISKESGIDLKDVDKVVVDASNKDSIRAMVKMSDVVLNCVGPYILYGEDIVKACVEEGTHHLDLSGEPQYLEKMQLLYNKEAENSGAYIIGACGFDSIPADFGSVYLEKNFDGQLNSVESFLVLHKSKKIPKINYGTWHSAIIMCNRFFEMMQIKEKLYPEKYFKFQHKISKMPITYGEDINAWCVNLPFPDGRVMDRTQRYRYYEEKRKPLQTQAWMKVPNIFAAVFLCIGVFLLGVFAQFRIGLYLLEKYPGLFSFGKITREGPSKEEMDVNFDFVLVGKGWDKSVTPVDGKYPFPPNKKVVAKVQGHNPGYGATVICMLQAGLTIIKERGLMPSKGGVYTPGIAFARTSLADRLTRYGVIFSVKKH